MLPQLVLGAVGLGFAAGVAARGKATGFKRKVENRIKPRKNKVAHIKVELQDGVDPSDLRFLVVQPVRKEATPTVLDLEEELYE